MKKIFLFVVCFWGALEIQARGEEAADSISLYAIPNSFYSVYASKSESKTAICSVKTGEDLLCTVKIHRRDLKQHGFKLLARFSGRSCTYKHFSKGSERPEISTVELDHTELLKKCDPGADCNGYTFSCMDPGSEVAARIRVNLQLISR